MGALRRFKDNQSREAVWNRKPTYVTTFLDSCRAQGYDEMDTLYFAPNDQRSTVSKSVELSELRCVCSVDSMNAVP